MPVFHSHEKAAKYTWDYLMNHVEEYAKAKKEGV